MKRLLLLALLVLAPGLTWANNCTCPVSTTCAISSSTNWTTCGGVAPTATDSITVNGTVNFDGASPTKTFLWISVENGGTFACTFTGTATLNLNTVTSWPGSSSTFFVVKDGATLNCNGVDLAINWTGTTAAAKMDLGQSQGNTPLPLTSASAATVTLRGVERAKTNIGTFSEGVTTGETNFVDCIKYPTGFSPASTPVVGDTIVFTTGLSKEFWYQVSGVGTTTECTATSCGGSTCDLEITRNSTGSTPGSVASSNSWDSMTMVASLGGPNRHATPVDNDANGVANSSGTRPAAGDAFVVFKPVLIQGGTTPVSKGAMLFFGNGHYNVRYLELNKFGASPTSACNASFSTDLQDWFADFSASPEGDLGFINIHNFYTSGQGLWEKNASQDVSSSVPNRPAKWSHFYVHDTDSTTTGCSAGQGTPAVFTTVENTNYTMNGWTVDGYHVARVTTGSAIDTGSGAQVVLPAAQLMDNFIFRNVIFHDCPSQAGYGTVCNAMNISHGVHRTVQGLAVWDIGRTSVNATSLNSGPLDNDSTVAQPTSTRIENAFIVNVDTNAAVATTIAGVSMNYDIPGNTTPTDATIVTNSYFSRNVGASLLAGKAYFNFIKNDNIGDTGSCLADVTASIQLPVEAVGNVITRDIANSCIRRGISWNPAGANQYTNRTRKAVSNLIRNLDTTQAADIFGIWDSSPGVGDPVNLDVYHNVIDMGNNFGFASSYDGGIYFFSDGGGKLTAYFNTILNCTNPGGGGCPGIYVPSGVQDEGYNRFINNLDSPAVVGGNHTGDVDSDSQDSFALPASNFYQQLCSSPDKTRNPWGGPVGPLAYGIRSFDRFLPAVIPLMDAEVFKFRFDWRECSAAYQDSVPR